MVNIIISHNISKLELSRALNSVLCKSSLSLSLSQFGHLRLDRITSQNSLMPFLSKSVEMPGKGFGRK